MASSTKAIFAVAEPIGDGGAVTVFGDALLKASPSQSPPAVIRAGNITVGDDEATGVVEDKLKLVAVVEKDEEENG